MALQFHPEYANLLAVGCYDGSVAVYDVRQKTNKPLYAAAPKAKKHTDTVWQVCWQVSECARAGCDRKDIVHIVCAPVCACLPGFEKRVSTDGAHLIGWCKPPPVATVQTGPAAASSH